MQELPRTLKLATVWLLLGTALFVAVLWLQRERASTAFHIDGDRIEIRRGADGHYHWRGRIAGEPVEFLVDTGAESMTGGRLKRVRDYLPDDEPFCMTYGDAVADINIGALVKFHKEQGMQATLTAVRPAGRFGATMLEGSKVSQFTEKPAGDGAQINGGFFVLNKKVIDRIADDTTVWEREPLESLARDGQLAAFVHNGFWQPMDTLRDKIYLEKLWTDGEAPWKVW